MACNCYGGDNLSPKVLYTVSECIQDGWENLGRELLIDDYKISGIDRDHHRVQEKAYQVLLLWKRQGHCKCKLVEVLEHMKREDIVSKIVSSGSISQWRNYAGSQQPPPKFSVPLRSDDLEKIVRFTDFVANACFLLAIVGLPGSGKRELLHDAIPQISASRTDLDIVRVMQSSKQAETCSSVDSVWCSILQKLNLPLSESPYDALCAALSKRSCSTLIVIDLTAFKLDHEETVSFWSSLHDIFNYDLEMRRNVKIIVSCLRLPEYALCGDPAVSYIRLWELDLNTSVLLLQSKCPGLSDEHAYKIALYAGGIAAFLMKIGSILSQHSGQTLSCEVDKLLSKLSNPCSRYRYVSAWIRDSFGYHIQRLCCSLSDTELGALVLFVATNGSFKSTDIHRVFRKKVEDIADRLSSLCCMFECEKDVYRLNPVVQSLLRAEIADNERWKSYLLTSERKYISYFVELVRQCGIYVFDEEKDVPSDLWQIFVKLRQECVQCESHWRESQVQSANLSTELHRSTEVASQCMADIRCMCSNYILVCRLFRVYEKDILYALQCGIDLDRRQSLDTISVILYTLPLLWKVLTYNDLLTLLHLCSDATVDKSYQLVHAAVGSSYAYLHLLYGSHSRELSLLYRDSLKTAHQLFERNTGSLTPVLWECFARVKLKLGFLTITLQGKCIQGIKMMKDSLEIREAMGSPGILKAGCYIELSIAYLKIGRYGTACQRIQQAIKVFGRFDSHPFAAQSFRQLGNIYMNQGQEEVAITPYKKALELDQLLFQTHGETVQSLSSLAIAHVRLGQREEGETYLRQVVAMTGDLTDGNIEHLIRRCGALPEEIEKAFVDWVRVCHDMGPSFEDCEDEDDPILLGFRLQRDVYQLEPAEDIYPVDLACDTHLPLATFGVDSSYIYRVLLIVAIAVVVMMFCVFKRMDISGIT